MYVTAGTNVNRFIFFKISFIIQEKQVSQLVITKIQDDIEVHQSTLLVQVDVDKCHLRQ
jgi:hypothetical protein